jgi:hypothetical protein
MKKKIEVITELCMVKNKKPFQLLTIMAKILSKSYTQLNELSNKIFINQFILILPNFKK